MSHGIIYEAVRSAEEDEALVMKLIKHGIEARDLHKRCLESLAPTFAIESPEVRDVKDLIKVYDGYKEMEEVVVELQNRITKVRQQINPAALKQEPARRKLKRESAAMREEGKKLLAIVEAMNKTVKKLQGRAKEIEKEGPKEGDPQIFWIRSYQV